ncbi:hypothetical protein [Escherichia coli]|uniref:hypothetical protein n=1 Tax=Escherichia coli TaxID=562 RepID=UPI0030860AFC|nr:hypothetical protein VEGS20_A40790 [Escherichia coli]
MIRNIFKRFTNQTFRCPRPGQWYTTPAGHVLRVSLVDRECQKVICEPLGRSYRRIIFYCYGGGTGNAGKRYSYSPN